MNDDFKFLILNVNAGVNLEQFLQDQENESSGSDATCRWGKFILTINFRFTKKLLHFSLPAPIKEILDMQRNIYILQFSAPASARLTYLCRGFPPKRSVLS